MSYILEALRKADAQRESAKVPGLHAQPRVVAEPVAAQRWSGGTVAALAGLAAVAIGAASWWLASHQSPAPAAPVDRIAEAAPAAPPVQSAAVVPEPARPVEPAKAIEPPAPPPVARPVEAERPVRSATAPAAAAPGEPVPVVAAPAAPVPAPAIANTPPPGLPALAVTGGVYSQNPAQRMLIVNGQVFNEGSEVGGGVRLEEVRPKQAVLNFQGQRFTLPY